jgi:para-aminobenzoate synthetase component 1
MKHPQIQPISWQGGPATIHRALQNELHSFCLYSGVKGRFSYVGSNPLAHLAIYPNRVEWFSRSPSPQPSPVQGEGVYGKNPFDVMKKIISFSSQVSPSSFFASGWVGFLGYEMASFADEALPRRDLSTDTLIGWWGFYDPVFVFDHVEERAWIASWKDGRGGVSPPEIAVPVGTNIPGGETPPLRSNFTKAKYLQSVKKVLEYISAGDCYQVNLSQQLKGNYSHEQNLVDLFWNLVSKHPAPFSAFLDCGKTKILSLSPEEFITIRGNKITTRPIKGTRRRGSEEHEDPQMVEDLKNSLKDQAELLMIVDLERNDLGKVCQPGSIRVPHLKQVESFDYVHHLVATIEGELREGIHPIDAIRALFPGGSITGAPKRRAMEIIQELEPDPRGVYTGVIGFLDFSPLACLNIAIRTLEVTNGEIKFGVGGGIVADSDPSAEYEETLTKAKVCLE